MQSMGPSSNIFSPVPLVGRSARDKREETITKQYRKNATSSGADKKAGGILLSHDGSLGW